MEERQLRLTVVLALVLAGAAAAYYLWEPADDEDAFRDEDATEEVWDVEAEGVVRVELTGPDDRRLVAEKEDGDWWLREPAPYRGDDRKLDYLVEDLARVDLGIPVPDVDPAEFGLGEPPRVRAALTWEDGTAATLDLGDEALGSRLYARAAAGGVAAVGGTITYALAREPSYYRDNRAFDFERAAVDRVRIDGPEGALDLALVDHEWWLEGWTRADRDKVQELLMSLLDIRVDDWYDDFAGPIEEPEYTVRISDDEGGTWELRVGEESPMGVLLQLPSGAAAWTRPEPLAFLGQGPVDVGDPHAFPVDRITLTGVDVALGDASWSLEKVDDEWTRGGETEPAAEGALEALEAAKISYRREAPLPPIQGWGTVTLRSVDLAPREVRCGQLVEETHRVCVDLAGGSPYLVSVEDLEGIAAALSR